MAPKILIYTTNHCPYCVRAKTYFKEHGLAYEEVDLTDRFDEIDALKTRTGHKTVPQIFIDDQFIGGYSDMMAKIESGELKI
jgi:glutaredoxin